MPEDSFVDGRPYGLIETSLRFFKKAVSRLVKKISEARLRR